jgi:choline dehydrogenase-like flavoprotein
MPENYYYTNETIKIKSFKAIVVGSGISGGWAAKELCEKGIQTLVIERGRKVEHNKDYPTANLSAWELKHRGPITEVFKKQNPLITKSAGFGEDNAHFFIEDATQPYIQEKPFDWIRGYQVGGKSIIVYLRYRRMLKKIAGNFHGIVAMPFHTKFQGFYSLGK